MLSRKQSRNPCISPEILAFFKQKIKLYFKYFKTKCPKQLKIYKKIRNKVTHEKEVAKWAYIENLFRNANNSTDTWKLVNKILCKRKPKVETLNLLKADENLVSNSQEICNAMIKHFVEVDEKLSAKAVVFNLILVQNQILNRKVDRSRNQLNENFQLVLCTAAGFHFLAY